MSVGNLFRMFLCVNGFSGRRKCSGGKNVRSDSFGPFSPTFIFAHFCRQNVRLHNDFPPFTTYYLIMFFCCSFFCRWLCWVPLCFFSFFVRAFFIALRLKQKRQVRREILLWNFFRRDRTAQRKNSKKRVRKATNPR